MWDSMCATWCNACSTGDHAACAAVNREPQCARACPPSLQKMGALGPPPLLEAMESFVGDKSYWDDDAEAKPDDRDSRFMKTMTTAPHPTTAGGEAMHGGRLRERTHTETAPHRSDIHPQRVLRRGGSSTYTSPRYVPIGFARYEYTGVNPLDYVFLRTTGGIWRVALHRSLSAEKRAAVLQNIAMLGPKQAGFARVEDTLVPSVLGPGDREVLARSAPSAYPLA